MKMLNDRKAVIFIHPTELPSAPIPGIPTFALDFLLDTSRAAFNLVASGVISKYTDLKFILSHAGGFIPYIIPRITSAFKIYGMDYEQSLKDLKRFYFDIAISSGPYNLPTLFSFADPSHILFGSDYPYANKMVVKEMTEEFDSIPMSSNQYNSINYNNALILFPRFSKYF
jgi:predicted TIM-barrel fold metal-dependent hydrolase